MREHGGRVRIVFKDFPLDFHAGARPSAEAATLAPADVAAIRAASRIYEQSGNARDWRTLAGIFTSDIVWMPPHAPSVSGLKAVESMLENYPRFRDLKLEPVEIEGRGDLAYVHGRYSLVLTPDHQPAQPDAG